MKTIPDPYITGFEFVAGQLGASEVQIAHFTRRTARTIMKSNQQIGSVLAFPYHGNRGPSKVTLAQVEMWWDEWQVKNKHILRTIDMTLQAFRNLVDPWMKHIDSPKDNEGTAGY